MSKVSPTRSALLERKAQIGLAKQGKELLDEKRAALVQEIMRIAGEVMEEASTLDEVAEGARRALARAEAFAGPEAVRSAALSTRSELPLKVETVNVMGVRVPKIEQRRVSRSFFDRGYSLTGTSILIDEAASEFEAELDIIIELAESELRLQRLAQELQTTTRRLNALEHVLIPRLESERDYIQFVLGERERSDHFRLKLAKRRLEQKRAA